MADRVLSTGEARQAILKMQSIVNGPLIEQINALIREGTTLGQPDVWDGRLAVEFRTHWAETAQQLQTIRETLEQLRLQMQMINQNIMQAGGNQ